MLSVRDRLIMLTDPQYLKFTSPLIPGETQILGVRIPALREMAKEIARADAREFLRDAGIKYHEERILTGLVIGYADVCPQERLEWIAKFVPLINNWAVCDTFCMNLSFTAKNKSLVWDFLQPYFVSANEFDVRFGAIMMLSWFVDQQYIPRIFSVSDTIRNDGYYAKMALAWVLQKCFVKFPDRTLDYLNSNSLDDFTYNKALQKIIESRIPDKETKDLIRSMKRKS